MALLTFMNVGIPSDADTLAIQYIGDSRAFISNESMPGQTALSAKRPPAIGFDL